MRAHQIQDGKIINTIEVNSLDIIPNLIDADKHGGSIGDQWDGKKVIPSIPVIQVPKTISMRQARSALFKAGLLDRVNAAVKALNGPDDELVRIAWEFATTVERNNYVVERLASSLGLSDSELDNLFILAAQLD